MRFKYNASGKVPVRTVSSRSYFGSDRIRMADRAEDRTAGTHLTLEHKRQSLARKQDGEDNLTGRNKHLPSPLKQPTSHPAMPSAERKV